MQQGQGKKILPARAARLPDFQRLRLRKAKWPIVFGASKKRILRFSLYEAFVLDSRSCAVILAFA
jgi:hypothetical protein